MTQTFVSLSTQFFGLSGSTTVTETNTSGTSWSAPGVWGTDTGLQLGFAFSGFITDSNQVTPENGYPVSRALGVVDGPYTTIDWRSAPPAFNGTFPTGEGYEFVAVAPSYDSASNPTPTATIFDQGSFTQASQVEATISIPIQWEGITATPSYQQSFSTSVSTSLGWTVGCNFYNPVNSAPNPNDYALFYYLNDDTGSSSTFVHVWFMGWCEEQSGEDAYACP